MYNGQEVETIDCTPTWEALVQGMLNCYVQSRMDAVLVNDKEAQENIKNLEIEFSRMARTADKWIEHRQKTA